MLQTWAWEEESFHQDTSFSLSQGLWTLTTCRGTQTCGCCQGHFTRAATVAARTLPQPYSRFYVVSLVCVRILYQFVYRQGAHFLPRCWVPVLDAAPLLPVLIPGSVPHPGLLTAALTAPVPPLPVRLDIRLGADTPQPRTSSLHTPYCYITLHKTNKQQQPNPKPKVAAAGFLPFHLPTHPCPG